MNDDTLYISEAEIAALVDLEDVIDALERACARQARHETLEIPKALGMFGEGSSLHALGSAFPEAGLGGFKTWINTKRGAQAVMTVFDTLAGRLIAILDAGVLGQLRTAAISGLATRLLAPAGAADMALIGTGRQAMMQVAAVAAVRPLQRLRVFSPSAANRAAFAAAARHAFSFAIVESSDIESAVNGAEIVTLVTRAKTPFLSAAMLAPGAHVNAVGSILPGYAEFTPDVFKRARAVVVDSLAGVQRNSQEFMDQFGPPGDSWSTVQTLAEVITDDRSMAGPADGITLFKAMGMGISDLAVAQLVIERARQGSVGVGIKRPSPAKPRWRSEKFAAE